MEQSSKSIFVPVIIALIIGLVVGYFAGVGTSSQGGTTPEIFAFGTELIDTFHDPEGEEFDLTSVFAFTKDAFHCVIETNDATFTMPTYALGTVEIAKNSFFMAVDSVSVDKVERTGDQRMELSGTARSITRIGDQYEEAVVPFVIRAVDGGEGYQNDGLTLILTYSEETSPMQFAAFGPEPHFGKGILSGDIAFVE